MEARHTTGPQKPPPESPRHTGAPEPQREALHSSTDRCFCAPLRVYTSPLRLQPTPQLCAPSLYLMSPPPWPASFPSGLPRLSLALCDPESSSSPSKDASLSPGNHTLLPLPGRLHTPPLFCPVSVSLPVRRQPQHRSLGEALLDAHVSSEDALSGKKCSPEGRGGQWSDTQTLEADRLGSQPGFSTCSLGGLRQMAQPLCATSFGCVTKSTYVTEL